MCWRDSLSDAEWNRQFWEETRWQTVWRRPMSDGKTDPREHRDHGNDGESKTPQAGESEARPAPGGAGTGDKNSPEKEPAAQPGKRE